MIAEYNHWYKCQEGQMPEDFSNIKENEMVIVTETKYYNKGTRISVDYRYKDTQEDRTWYYDRNGYYLVWMLPEPYKEEK